MGTAGLSGEIEDSFADHLGRNAQHVHGGIGLEARCPGMFPSPRVWELKDWDISSENGKNKYIHVLRQMKNFISQLCELWIYNTKYVYLIK